MPHRACKAKATPLLVTAPAVRSSSGGLMRERSEQNGAALSTQGSARCTRRRAQSPQFWGSDASLSHAAAGTVRLHASSHARGLMLC